MKVTKVTKVIKKKWNVRVALTGRVFKILIILMSNLSPKYPPN